MSSLNEKPKIMFMIDLLKSGGAEKQISLICEKIAGRGFEASMCLLGQGGDWSRYLERRGVTVHTPDLGWKPLQNIQSKECAWRLVEFLKREGPDATVTFLSRNLLICSLASHEAGVPVIIGSRRDSGGDRDYLKSPSAFPRNVMDHFYEVTDQFVANNPVCSRALAEHEGIPREKVAFIPNAVDLPEYDGTERGRFRKQWGIQEGQLVVGMIANFWAYKNHGLLVDAASRIIRNHRDVRFVLVGQPFQKYREVLEKIEARGLKDFFVTVTDCNEGWKLLPAFDIGVLCSTGRAEGMSNSVLEYCAAGLPVVATELGTEGVVIHGRNGFRLDSEKPDLLNGFTDALQELIVNPSLRMKMGREGRKLSEEVFTWEPVLNQWEKLIRAQLAHPSKRKAA